MNKQEAFNLLTNHGKDHQAVEFLYWQQYFQTLRKQEQTAEEHF